MSKNSPQERATIDLCLVAKTERDQLKEVHLIPASHIREDIVKALEVKSPVHCKGGENIFREGKGPARVTSQAYRENYGEIDWGTPPSRDQMN